MNDNIQAMSLLEFNSHIRMAVESSMLRQWVVGEISEIFCASNGHYYLELVEKSARNGSLVAKLRCTIWSANAAQIVPMFVESTGQQLQVGLKVMVFVCAQFHEAYGLSGNITAINPSFTIGEVERQRREIISRLMAEGVMEMNKEKQLPTVIQDVAVISAANAAGYGDFCNQIAANRFGIKVRLQLFEALMQGVAAEESIIAALDAIASSDNPFDAVVIIRGGGSRSDLACFDSYDLANNVAQFPLPVITGIGHERDNSVVDLVANTRQKTPTAVAEFIIGHNAEFLEKIELYWSDIENVARAALSDANATVTDLGDALTGFARNSIANARTDFAQRQRMLQLLLANRLNIRQNEVGRLRSQLSVVAKSRLQKMNDSVASLTKIVEAVSPRDILRRGYTITIANGKRLRRPSDVAKGQTITTVTIEGSVDSVVK